MSKHKGLWARLNKPLWQYTGRARAIGHLAVVLCGAWLVYESIAGWLGQYYNGWIDIAASIFWALLGLFIAWFSFCEAATTWRDWRSKKRWDKRMSKGACPACNYPVRDWTTGACPECGYFVGVRNARALNERSDA